MRGGKQKQGYTVVEVMIFLAISGVMFLIAGNFISGKQARSEFKQGMNDLNSQIKLVINDVSNGFYPSRGGFRCTAAAGSATAPSFPTGGTPNDQGENQGCTFMGKVMQFNVLGQPVGTYNTYTIVGRQFRPTADGNSSFLPPSTFTEAQPVAATASTSNLTQTGTLKWGIRLERMTSDGAPIGAFGIFNGFSETNADNDLASGAAAPIAVGIDGSAPNQNPTFTTGRIAALATVTDQVALINSNPNIIMCFTGSDGQFGRLTIGTSNNVQAQKLTTTIQITTGAPAAGCT